MESYVLILLALGFISLYWKLHIMTFSLLSLQKRTDEILSRLGEVRKPAVYNIITNDSRTASAIETYKSIGLILTQYLGWSDSPVLVDNISILMEALINRTEENITKARKAARSLDHEAQRLETIAVHVTHNVSATFEGLLQRLQEEDRIRVDKIQT